MIRLLFAILLGGVLPGAVLLGLVGCAGARADPGGDPLVPGATRWPAGAAGGACQLLDYDVVEATVGTRFDVSAAGSEKDTYTCVLQPTAGSYPDLTLAVTATTADVTAFRTAFVPRNATLIPSLGKIGYSASRPAAGRGGPAIEVGWLAGNGRLLVLRYRFPKGVPGSKATPITPRLVELARKIDDATL
jgi:hypothetical protein